MPMHWQVSLKDANEGSAIDSSSSSSNDRSKLENEFKSPFFFSELNLNFQKIRLKTQLYLNDSTMRLNGNSCIK